MVRVLLASHVPALRDSIALGLSQVGDVEVVGESAATSEQAILLVTSAHPNVVALDAALPGDSVLSLIQKLSACSRVVVLSRPEDADLLDAFIAAGAMGLAQQCEETVVILATICDAASADQPVISPVSEERLAQAVLAKARQPRAVLTDEERDTLRLVAEGKTNPQIAHAHSITVKAVEKRLSKIYKKLDVRSRTEAAIKAKENGLI